MGSCGELELSLGWCFQQSPLAACVIFRHWRPVLATEQHKGGLLLLPMPLLLVFAGLLAKSPSDASTLSSFSSFSYL